MPSKTMFALALALVAIGALAGDDRPTLQKAFPNHALVLQPPEAASRATPVNLDDTEIPFSWPQSFVVREDSFSERYLRGYDPESQRVQFEIQPSIPEHVRVQSFDGDTGLMQATIRPKTGGLKEVFKFRVIGHGVTSTETYDLTYDIRETNDRLRFAPFVLRSPGEFVRPGQTVRYAWTVTTRAERFPKCEAQLLGKTSVAKGTSSSKITRVLAIKVQPVVLGHYVMLVTPRDVIGEPARGSTGSGPVFRCAFGSENLAPVTDGLLADTFTPAVGQVITVKPNAIDPETGQSEFDNAIVDFGDGTVLTGVNGAATHAYANPGIYRVRCTVADAQGVSAVAEDSVIVGATVLSKMPFDVRKQIIPEEAGSGQKNSDELSAFFKDVNAQPGDRLVFLYNRNQFGRTFASDASDDTDIVLKAGGGFSGKTRLAKTVRVSGGKGVSIEVENAQLDRTGDPRLGRAERKGIFRNQRIALAIFPADNSTPRAYLYAGNMEIRVTGGVTNRVFYDAERVITGKTTLKEPDPKKQEAY